MALKETYRGRGSALSFGRQLLAVFMCFALFVGLSCAPVEAYADVYKSDILLGKKGEERDSDIERGQNIFCARASMIDEE